MAAAIASFSDTQNSFLPANANTHNAYNSLKFSSRGAQRIPVYFIITKAGMSEPVVSKNSDINKNSAFWTAFVPKRPGVNSGGSSSSLKSETF